MCDSRLKIRDIVVRWAGSVHDMTIFNHSRLRARMEGREFPNTVLLGKVYFNETSPLLTFIKINLLISLHCYESLDMHYNVLFYLHNSDYVFLQVIVDMLIDLI